MRCCSMTSNHLMFVKVVFVGPVGSRSVIRLWKMFWWQKFIISLQLEILGSVFSPCAMKNRHLRTCFWFFFCSTRWRESYDLSSFILFFRINFPAAVKRGFFRFLSWESELFKLASNILLQIEEIMGFLEFWWSSSCLSFGFFWHLHINFCFW